MLDLRFATKLGWGMSGGVMATSKRKIVAITVFAAAALSVCGVSAAELEPVVPGEERIFFSAPEFSNINPIHQKLENADTRQEYGVFRGAGMHAVIGFLETKSDETVFHFDLSVKGVVDMLYYDKTHKKEWGSASRVDSGLGSFSVKKFRVSEKNQECFGFSMEDAFGVVDDASSGPSKILLGYYCAKEGDPLPLSKITSLIKSITVKY